MIQKGGHLPLVSTRMGNAAHEMKKNTLVKIGEGSRQIHELARERPRNEERHESTLPEVSMAVQVVRVMQLS